LWIEKLLLAEHENEHARNLIFADLIQQKPLAVFHLGDLVGLGFEESQWQVIDQFLARLGQQEIPFFPALGNHELMIFPDDGALNFTKRFPFFIKTGYTRRIGNTAVILLNSNFDHMHEVLINKQQEWYENELVRLSMDSVITHIIVGCHHPPYTNSSIVSASEEVQQRFVKPFLKYDKCRLFISGHAHRFEHFQIGGKDFIVAGGGGGLQHPEIQDTIKEYSDRYASHERLRPFHYIEVYSGPHLRLVMRRLDQDQDKIVDGYTVRIADVATNWANYKTY